MHPDNAAPLILAARKRRELARAKAVRALRELDRAGTPVTFQTVARAAGVSRSWLYNQPDLRAEIQRLRQATSRATTPPIPASQRNRQLAEENSRLRRQLAHALGDQRASPRPARQADPGDPAGRSPVTIQPP